MGHLKDKSFVRITPKVARVGKAVHCPITISIQQHSAHSKANICQNPSQIHTRFQKVKQLTATKLKTCPKPKSDLNAWNVPALSANKAFFFSKENVGYKYWLLRIVWIFAMKRHQLLGNLNTVQSSRHKKQLHLNSCVTWFLCKGPLYLALPYQWNQLGLKVSVCYNDLVKNTATLP